MQGLVILEVLYSCRRKEKGDIWFEISHQINVNSQAATQPSTQK